MKHIICFSKALEKVIADIEMYTIQRRLKMCKMLNLKDVQTIVNAVLKETEVNEEFKHCAFNDIEKAIKYIIDRDFSNEVIQRYDHTLEYYKKKYGK